MRYDDTVTYDVPTARVRSSFGVPVHRSGLLLSVAIASVAVALLVVHLLLGVNRRAEHGPVRVAVWIDVRHPGAPVPQRFLGLSFELSSLGQIARYADSGNLATLLRSLGPGVLRFGGASADTQAAWTDPVTPRPAWASVVLEIGELRKLRKLAARSGWRVLLTIGLIHYDPRAAAREARAAKAALGPWLAGIEVGNEPNTYARHHFRPLPWTYSQYDAQVASYRRAIARVAPGIPFAGPDVSGSNAFARWGPSEAIKEKPALLTGHHYPLGCHDTPAPTIARLLSGRVRRLERNSLASYMSVSRASAIPLRLDETNTVSCGGKAGISNTFASALWAVDYITQTMVGDAAGINLQGNPANCRGYSPLCATTPARLARGALSAQPEWYALLLTKALIGDRPLRTTVASPERPNVAVMTLLADDGSLHFVIVDDDPPGASAAAVSLRVGRTFRSARILPLTAPSPGASSGIELGGRAVARDGSWREPTRLRQIAAQGGVIALTVPPSSAALVTVTPAHGSVGH
jgi:hypothetical protein